jgi:hypothetical protein
MFTAGWAGGALIGAFDLSIFMVLLLAPIFYIIGRMLSNL